MKRYMVHLRGNFYSFGPVEQTSMKAMKQWVREWLRVSRLPPGTEIYEA